jgi:D-alanyl-D-alanine carboxypeptidase/D-alanyl-D-alanine-endopeptidase (penicillin-binding protein 4)
MTPIRNRARLPAFLCLLGLFIHGGYYPAHGDQLPASVTSLLDKYGIPLSAVSIDIREADTNRSVTSLNSDQARNPASVIKLVVTLAALEILGPDYQWETRYFVDGRLNGDVLEGDLVIEGGGDPFITSDRLWHQVMSIRERGIRTITGSLVIDNSLFNTPAHDRAAFDKQPTRLYNVGPSALLTNFSATRFVIYPIGNRVAVLADPPLADMVVNNRLNPAQGKCTSKNSGWTYGLEKSGEKIVATFSGKYRTRCDQHSISRSLISNNEYTFRLFKYLWNSSGGKFDGGYRIAPVPEDAATLIAYPSEPLADVVTSINKYSNNVMTRMLFLTLDAQQEDRPATIEGARKMVNDWLVVSGLQMPALYIDNGSGLSRKSRITSAGLADLLQHGWASNYRPEFLSSLSLSALDGTMRKRLHDSGLQGRARIKTGLINGVRSMAGYVNSRKNTHYSVAMMIESSRVTYWNGNKIQDAILEWIYNL